MIALLHAEARKLLATRSWLALFAAPIVYPIVVVAVMQFAPMDDAPELSAADVVRGAADIAKFAALILGILAVAGEHRHGTIIPTLLAAPRRRTYIAAKLTSQAAVAAAMVAAATVVSVAAAGAHLAGQGRSVDLWSGELALVALGMLAVTVFYATAGAAIGAIVRNQTAVVTGALLWVLAIEEVVPIVLGDPGLRRWLPGGAATRLLHASEVASGTTNAWVAAMMLAAVAIALAAAAAAVTTRADVE